MEKHQHSDRLLIALLYIMALVWPVLLGVPLWASNITGATYYGIIQVVNNSTANTSVSSNITNMSVQEFLDGGYLASASNTTMAMQTTGGADVAFQPGYGSSTWMAWVPTIPDNGNLNYLFYTGTIVGGKLRYFPGATGMTIADTPALELGGNFTIEQAGYIDTSAGASKNLVSKLNAFKIYVDGATNIAGVIDTAGVNERVSASILNVSNVFGNNWSGQSFTPRVTHVLSQVELYLTKTGAPPGNLVVDIHLSDADGKPIGAALSSANIVAAGVPAGPEWVAVAGFGGLTLDLGTMYTMVVSVPAGTLGNMLNWHGFNTNTYSRGKYMSSANGGVTWTLHSGSDFSFREYGTPFGVAAVGVAAGLHDIRVTADGTDLKIYVDGIEEDSVAWAGTVPDNGNGWTFLQNGVMPYMEYHRITVGGTLQQYIVWEYGATFTDLSGNGHDVTPSFAVDSTDTDITATMTAYRPVGEAQAPAYSVGSPPDFFTVAPNLTSEFRDTVTPTMPGADVVTDAAASSGTPSQLPWVMIASFSIVGLSLLTTYVLRAFGSQASVLVKLSVVGTLMAAAIAVGVFDFWQIIFFLFPAIAIGLASRPQESLG